MQHNAITVIVPAYGLCVDLPRHAHMQKNGVPLFSHGLGSLTDLSFTVGTEGYDCLELRSLSSLTSLVIDNCEYVQLDRTHLPPSLKLLSIKCWFGLKELYLLGELKRDAPAVAQGLSDLEDRFKVSWLCLPPGKARERL